LWQTYNSFIQSSGIQHYLIIDGEGNAVIIDMKMRKNVFQRIEKRGIYTMPLIIPNNLRLDTVESQINPKEDTCDYQRQEGVLFYEFSH
jgi:hypothetical protein